MMRSLLTVAAATVLGGALLIPGAGPAQAAPPLIEGVQNWSAPGNVAAPTYLTGNPVSAFSTNGTTGIAVWVEGSDCSDGCNNWAVMASTAKVSGSKVTWGSPFILSSQYSREPAVAINADGSLATVLFHNETALVTRTAAVAVTPTGTTANWGPEAEIDTDSANQPGKWSLGVSDDGVRMVVAYVNDDQNTLKSRTGSLSETTATWGDATYPVGNVANPTVVISGDGQNALVGATDSDQLETAYGSTDFSGNPTTDWGSAETKTAAGGIGALRLALSDDGEQPNALWYTNDNSYAVQSASATVSGTLHSWGSITTLAAGDNDNRSSSPALDTSDDGTALTATWTKRTDAGPPQVYSRSASVGGQTQDWGDPTAPITDDTANAYTPSVGVSGDGSKATLTWFRYDSGQSVTRLYSQSGRIAGTTQAWSSPNVLTANGFDTGTENGSGTIAVNGTGTRALAVWRGSNSNGPVQSAGAMLFVPAAPTLGLSGNELTITPGANASRITSYAIVYTTTSRATSPTANWGIWASKWPSSGSNPITIDLRTYQPIATCQAVAVGNQCFRPTASGGIQLPGQTRVYRVFADSAEGRSAASATQSVTLS